jgi:hypothetical protein
MGAKSDEPCCLSIICLALLERCTEQNPRESYLATNHSVSMIFKQSNLALVHSFYGVRAPYSE